MRKLTCGEKGEALFTSAEQTRRARAKPSTRLFSRRRCDAPKPSSRGLGLRVASKAHRSLPYLFTASIDPRAYNSHIVQHVAQTWPAWSFYYTKGLPMGSCQAAWSNCDILYSPTAYQAIAMAWFVISCLTISRTICADVAPV